MLDYEIDTNYVGDKMKESPKTYVYDCEANESDGIKFAKYHIRDMEKIKEQNEACIKHDAEFFEAMSEIVENEEAELLKKKRVHYGDIHECPHSQMIIATRMLDKTRRLVQREYLRSVLRDFGDIDEVRDRIGNIDAVEEDTVADLENYTVLYKEGSERLG